MIPSISDHATRAIRAPGAAALTKHEVNLSPDFSRNIVADPARSPPPSNFGNQSDQ